MWPMKAKTTLVSFHKEVLYTVYQFVSEYCTPDFIVKSPDDPEMTHKDTKVTL